MDAEISDEAPPMMPAMPTGASVGITDEAVLTGVAQARPGPTDRPGHPVQRLDGLARRGPPHDEARPRQLSQVVGVGRLPQLEHDVVGGVDHVVDGAHAGQRQAPGDPLRRRADR